jgi:hypothetical protein
MTHHSNRAGNGASSLLVRYEAQSSERDRGAAILEIGQAHGVPDLAARAIRDGVSVSSFAEQVRMHLEARRSAGAMPATRAGSVRDGQDLVSAVRELFAERGQRDGEDSLRVSVPWHALRAGATTSDFLGAVSTDARIDLAADALRDATVVERLGARILSGLTGDVAIPLVDGAGAAIGTETAVAGTETPTEASDVVTLSPKSGRAFTPISRRLMAQTGGQIEAVVRQDLLGAIAELIDTHALAAALAAAEEIEADENGHSHRDVVAARTALELAKYRPVRRGYVLSPLTIGALSVPFAVGGVAQPPVFTGQPWDGQVYGLPAAQHNAVEHVLYGEFTELFVGLFGPGVEINLGPADNAGNRFLRAWVEFDSKVRRPAFVKIAPSESSSS